MDSIENQSKSVNKSLLAVDVIVVVEDAGEDELAAVKRCNLQGDRAEVCGVRVLAVRVLVVGLALFFFTEGRFVLALGCGFSFRLFQGFAFFLLVGLRSLLLSLCSLLLCLN